MRNGRHILDQTNGKPSRLKRAYRGLSSRAGAFHVNFHGFHSVFDRFLGGLFGSHLRRERRRLFGPRKSGRAAAGPGHHVTGAVRDRDLRIVKCRQDVSHTLRDVPYDFFSGFKFLCFCHSISRPPILSFFCVAGCCFWSSFFFALSAYGFLRTFSCPCVSTGPLAMHRQTSFMS